MLLAEKIRSAVDGVEIILAGRKWVFPGAVAYSDRLIDCPARYVLGQDVQQACCQLAEGAADLLNPANPRLRAMQPDMWIEWAEAGQDGLPGARIGVLVDAAANGRAGQLRLFWTTSAGVDVAQASIWFDFDRPVDGRERGLAGYALDQLPAAFADLRPHLSIVVDDAWAVYFRASALGVSGLPEAARQCGEALWPDVIRGLAFFLLMCSRVPVSQRPVARGRLNIQRARAGKPALLDHVELRLGDPLSAHSGAGAGASMMRKYPRLHVVRGHLVRRQNNVFWRAAHIRGGRISDPLPATTHHVRMASHPTRERAGRGW